MISTLDLLKHIDEIKTKRGSVEARKAKESKISADESMRWTGNSHIGTGCSTG